MQFEEKLKEIISRAKRVQNITKEVLNLDQKVALGLKEAEANVEHYGIIFEKNSEEGNIHEEESPLAQLYKRYAKSSMENLEYITIAFNRFKRSSDKFIFISDSSKDVVQLNKSIKAPAIIDGCLTVEFEAAKIYETESLPDVVDIYSAILLKEKELATENAERLRNKLMSL